MGMTETAEMVSLILTIPTIMLAVLVIMSYGKRAMLAVRHLLHRDQSLTETDFLVMGITVSFVGATFDNAYWGFAWLSEFLGWPQRDALFAGGVFSNIPARQVAGIVAAVLHLAPILGFVNMSQRWARVVGWSTIGGAMMLMIAKFLS